MTHVTPSTVVWNVPWVTLLSVNVKLEFSASVTAISAGVTNIVPPSDTVSDAAVIVGGVLEMMIIGVTIAGDHAAGVIDRRTVIGPDRECRGVRAVLADKNERDRH